jgi:cbb3-type cytochrome oxidase subunit 1
LTTDTPASPPVVDSEISVHQDGPSKLAFRIGLLVLVVGVVDMLLQALRLSVPELLNIAGIAFGRTQPATLGALTFGWGILGAMAAAYYVVPRLVGPLRLAPLATLSVLAVAVGTLIGAVSILLFETAPGFTLEFPVYADALIIAGLVMAAGVVVETARGRDAYISVWFFAAAFAFAALGLLVSNLPMEGVGHLLSLRVGQASVWTAIVGAAVGTLYFVVPRVTGNALYSSKLGAISFWTLFGVMGWVGPVFMTYGPMPAWLDTMGALFSLSLVIPVAAVVGNLGLTLQGRWNGVTRSAALTFSAAALAALGLLVVHIIGLGVRSSSVVTQFTPWVEAGPVLVVLGIGTFAFLALRAEIAGDLPASLAVRSLVGGVLGLVGLLWVNGLVTGLTWLSGPNSGEFDNYGAGFANTTVQQVGFDVARWILWIPVLAGAAMIVVGWTRWNDEIVEAQPTAGSAPDSEEVTHADDAEGPDA